MRRAVAPLLLSLKCKCDLTSRFIASLRRAGALIYSDLGATVKVSGTRNGIALNGKDRVSNTFGKLEFTDGLNEIYLGGTYRWRWTPYVGVGVGLSFPYVEIRRTGSSTRTAVAGSFSPIAYIRLRTGNFSAGGIVAQCKFTHTAGGFMAKSVHAKRHHRNPSGRKLSAPREKSAPSNARSTDPTRSRTPIRASQVRCRPVRASILFRRFPPSMCASRDWKPISNSSRPMGAGRELSVASN